jgi:molecular chaperone DnaJ
LGANIRVPTLDGLEEIKIRQGTQPGAVRTLKRRGMPDPRGRQSGDLHVQIDIDVPEKLNEEQEALIRQLAELEYANVTPQRKSFLDKLKDYFVLQDTPVTEEE